MDQRVLKDNLYGQVARLGKALSSPKRLEIIDLLSQGERPVDAIANEADLTVGNASAHLQVLRAACLVENRREGQRVIYRLADGAVFRFMQEFQALARRQLAEVDRIARLYYDSPEELEAVTPQELLRRLRDGSVLVLDVRPRADYEAGHIPGAIALPPDEVEQRIEQLPRDRDIVAYCGGPYCLFSHEAVQRLRERGFRARRLDVGLPGWRDQGMPVALHDEESEA